VTASTPYSASLAKGTVIDWQPRTPTPHGTNVLLTVSAGPQPINVPDLRTLTYAQAKATLDGLGLPSTEAQVFDDTAPVGSVASTSPGQGSVPPGTTITINVSQGPKIVTVPDVTGDRIDQATAALTALGLQVGSQFGPSRSTRVIDTDPAPNSRVPHGSVINLYVGR
jgi:serine/threonine-protein kinase